MRYIRPMFYDANNNQLSASAFGVRHLFTGQQWYQELGLYDLRNRFYSPDLGRFLQPDPVGFSGDAGNLYRYCGNNAVTRSDPNGEYWPEVIITGVIIGALVYEMWYYNTHPTTWTGYTYPETPEVPNPPTNEELKPAPGDQYISSPAPSVEMPPPDDEIPPEYDFDYTFSSDVFDMIFSETVLQGDSYFVSSGGPGILSPPGGIPIGPLGAMGGDLGGFGGVIGASYLRHLMKGFYTSPYIYGEEKGLWGGINGKMGPWQQVWPSWQSLHASEVYWGNLFRNRGYIFSPSAGSPETSVPGSGPNGRLMNSQ